MPPKKGDKKKEEVVELPPEPPIPEWYLPWNGFSFVAFSDRNAKVEPLVEQIRSKADFGFQTLSKDEILKVVWIFAVAYFSA